MTPWLIECVDVVTGLVLWAMIEYDFPLILDIFHTRPCRWDQMLKANPL